MRVTTTHTHKHDQLNLRIHLSYSAINKHLEKHRIKGLERICVPHVYSISYYCYFIYNPTSLAKGQEGKLSLRTQIAFVYRLLLCVWLFFTP